MDIDVTDMCVTCVSAREDRSHGFILFFWTRIDGAGSCLHGALTTDYIYLYTIIRVFHQPIPETRALGITGGKG